MYDKVQFHFIIISLNIRNVYLCGDYNTDLLKMTSIQMHEDYFDNILSAGYIPTITLQTRLSENSTLIDNISTNNVSNQITAGILDTHISDHQPIIIFCNVEIPNHKTMYITITNNSDQAKAEFVYHLQIKMF